MKQIRGLYLKFGTQLKEKNMSAYAASTAFFIFISLVPMLVLLVAMFPYTPITEQTVILFLEEWMPDKTISLMEEIVNQVYQSSIGILSFAAVAMVWTAAKGVLALMRGLNAINEVVEKRNFVVTRLIAAFYMLIMLVIVLLTLLLMVFGNSIILYITSHAPALLLVFDFFNIFRFLIVWVILILVFMGVYAFVPNKNLKFRQQLPGAFFSTICWSIFSWGFSYYVDRTSAFSVYGSLSIIVIMMLWLYFCFYILLIGAYINKIAKPVVYHLKQKKHLTKIEEITKMKEE